MEEGDKKIVFYWSAKKTASLIYSIIIVPVFAIFLFSLVLKTTIINPNYYKANLKKVDAYNRLIQDGIPSLLLQSKTANNDAGYSKDLMVFVIREAVDPVWLENLTNKIIDQTVAFFPPPAKPGENLI